MAFLDITQRNETAAAFSATVMVLSGEIDQSTVAAFREKIIPLVENNSLPRFIFDCTQLKFINSEGIGLMMSFHTKLTKKANRMFFVGLQPQVKDVFELIGLTKLIPAYADMTSALAA